MSGDELKKLLTELLSIDVNVASGQSKGFVEVTVSLLVGDDVVCTASSYEYLNME